MLKLALVQYSFDAIEHSIQLKPHQNAKGTHMPPYRRQKASTVKNSPLLFKKLSLQQKQ